MSANRGKENECIENECMSVCTKRETSECQPKLLRYSKITAKITAAPKNKG